MQGVVIQDECQTLKLSGFRVANLQELREPWPLPHANGTDDWHTNVAMMTVWNRSIDSLAATLGLLDYKRQEIVMRTTNADHFFAVDMRRRLRAEDKPAYEAFLKLASLPSSLSPGHSQEDEQALGTEAWPYFAGISMAGGAGRRPFKSDQGHIRLAPEAAEVGDVVCLFHGATVPFVLRREVNGEYRLLGEAYVYGIMDGQFMDTASGSEHFVLC